MGNKARNFIVKNATIILFILNFAFFGFSIWMITSVQDSNKAMEDPSYPLYFRDNLDLAVMNDFIMFCGITVLVSSLAGLVIVFKPSFRKLLIFYMGLLLLLGFLQIIVGGYMNSRECEELRETWFTTTGYYNRARQDFKYYKQCCGFDSWNDDFFLDQDDKDYLEDERVRPNDTPGCFIDINQPNTETACKQVCDEQFKKLTSDTVTASVTIGVFQLFSGILVCSIICREKRRADPTTSAFYF